MLDAIHRLLAELYDVTPIESLDRFVCGPKLLTALAGQAAVERREVLLVVENEQGVHVGLYLDPKVLDALKRGAPSFDALCLATEGVSHFLYLSFREKNSDQVSQLELELQAEVDKYAAGLLAGNGVGAIQARSRALRERLFATARFIDAPDTEAGERYRVAHQAAARYAARLEARFVTPGRLEDLSVELRRFYRMGARAKLEHTRH
jgi:hypothetical protein